MNKRTKILFVIYLIIAPIVYFISSAHTPYKQHPIENFAHKYTQANTNQNLVIAFISSKTDEYQQALSQTFTGKAVKTMVFITPDKKAQALGQVAQTNKLKVYAGERYFKKAGINTGQKAPSLQLFVINKQKKLVYQEQHYDNHSLDLSKLVTQLNKL